MKHKVLKKLIASAIVISALITLVPIGASAAWINNWNGSWSYSEGYDYAKGWRLISGTWYFFDSSGIMRTGWINSGSEWYYADLSGAMQTGVVQIEGKIYLFSKDGAMQKGKCILNSKLYNFDDNGVCIGSDYPQPTKAFDYYGNSTIPYLPSQIIDGNASMSSDIPSDGTTKVKQYEVRFKDPDADSSDEELLKTKYVDENTSLALYKPTKSGYTFVEWNTKSNGDGTSYEYDDRITVKDDMTLYAQWEENTTNTPTTEVVKVTSISVSGANGISQITTKGGSLQMVKTLLPAEATNRNVNWTVSNGTGEATISSTGKLTAVSNGTVTAIATAADGSGVYGTFVVTISGQ